MTFKFEEFGAPMVEGPKEPEKKGFLTGIKESFTRRVDAAAGAQEKALAGKQSDVSAALQTIGQGAGFVGDIGFEAAKAVVPKEVKNVVKTGIEKVASTSVAQNLTEKYGQFKTQHPEAAANIESFLNIAAILPGTAAVGRLGTKTAEKIAHKTGSVLEASRVARIEESAKLLDEVVGKVVQGKTGDIPKAAQALRLIDTKGVKTYSQLGERIDDKVELLSTKLDEYLDAQKGELKPNELKTVTKVGDEAIEQNFVTDAIAQLKELHANTKDAPALAKITQLETKLNSSGLSRKELNDLAREYGSEFKNKAFSKIGDPLTSVSAQAFENTRKGIKNVVRGATEGDAPKLIDSQLSALLRTKPLVSKMEEKVSALYQKVQKRGILEQTARGVADVVNLATFNTLSGFISRLLPSNVGLKVLNSIDLERNLQRNLKKVNELLNTTNDDTIVQGLQELLRNSATAASKEIDVDTAIKNTIKDAQPGLSTKSVLPKGVPVPKNLLNEMSAKDLLNVQRHLDVDPTDANEFINTGVYFDKTVEKLGLKDKFATDEALERYLRDVLDEWNTQGMEGGIIGD